MLDTREVNRVVTHWNLVTGTTIVESEWDPYAPPYRPKMEMGPEGWMPVPKTGPDGAPLTGPDGKPEYVMEPKGALRRNVYTSLETFPEPGSSGPDNADWCFLVLSMAPEEVERRYGFKPKSASASASTQDGTGVAGRVGQLLQRAFGLFGEGFSYSTSASGLSRAVDVLRFYQAPCAEAPAGRLIVMIEGKVIYDDVSPGRGYFRFPFEVFNLGTHGKRWFPGGLVQRLLDIQREMNRTISRYAETLALMGNPRIWMPRQVKWNRESLTNRPGLVFEYDPVDGLKPEIAHGVTMPSDTFRHLERLENSFNRISGIEEALQGQMPSANASGRAIEALQGKNLQRLTAVAQKQNESWARVLRFELWLAGQYWDDGMKITAVGRNYKPMVVDFNRSDFSTPLDIVVQNGSALPQDPASRQQLLNQMFGPGGPMVTLPPDMRRFYLSLSKHGADLISFFDEETIFETCTRNQIAECMAGQPQQAIYNDDHRTARRILSMFMAGQEFKEAPDQVKALIADLDRQHALWELQPKDAAGINLPPGAEMAAVPQVPGAPPAPVQPNPQQAQRQADMVPQGPPQPSAPKMQPGK
jgi:hypothetical protein